MKRKQHRTQGAPSSPSSLPSKAADLLAVGQRAHHAGRLAEAEGVYQQVLGLVPGQADALHLFGILKAQQGIPALATALIGQAIAANPAQADYRNNIVPALMQMGRLAEAEGHLLEALRLRPGFFQAYNNLGNVLLELKRPEEAMTRFDQALAIQADYPEARLGRGRALTALERWSEAEDAIRQALVQRPGWPDGLYALGKLLLLTDRLAEAEAPLRQLLAQQPRHAEGQTALGLLLMESGRAGEAEAPLRLAVALRPKDPDSRCNLGQLLLSLGQYDEGWAYYEARLDSRRRQKVAAHGLPNFPCPRWHGEPLDGKSVLVWAEQGLGDMIQFSRYLPLLKQRGAARVSLCCYAPLARLLTTLDGVDAIIPQTPGQVEMPVHDYWVPPLSLPGLTKALPATLPYLHADEDLIKDWAARLPGGFKVGLVWKGSPDFDNDHHRSLRGPEILRPLWDVPNITFISLQKGAGEDQAAPPPADQPMLALGAELSDFADAAALVSQLDLVICVDTAIAHLAGALAKPCWLMLPARGTDWRWLHERDDSPWYPGVVRLFRQQTPGDWGAVVARMATALSRVRALP